MFSIINRIPVSILTKLTKEKWQTLQFSMIIKTERLTSYTLFIIAGSHRFYYIFRQLPTYVVIKMDKMAANFAPKLHISIIIQDNLK